MDDWNRQLWLLERLVGKDPLKLDPQLRGRLHGELEKATVAQLKAMDLMDAWLEAWEWRDESAEDEPAEEALSAYRRGHPRRLPFRVVRT